MPITFPKAPRGANARLVAHLAELARESKSPMAEMPMEELSHSEAHPVYFVPLDALTEGKLLKAAKQTSWRYLLVKGSAAIAEVELSSRSRHTKGGRSHSLDFLRFTRGPFASATVDALHAAERLPQIARADYELRLLNIPAVYLVALWLHSAKDDILIPMGDPPAGLKRNEPYNEPAVIAALRDGAGRARRFDESLHEYKAKRGIRKRS